MFREGGWAVTLIQGLRRSTARAGVSRLALAVTGSAATGADSVSVGTATFATLRPRFPT